MIPFTTRFDATELLPCPLIHCPEPSRFAPALRRLRQRFACYAATSPAPLPAPGLVITSEIRHQSELYLPIDEVRRDFYRLYDAALSYSPIYSSSPFHHSRSWADCFSDLPSWLQQSASPADLFEQLLGDHRLLTRFMCHSFLPARFQGAGFDRYPEQLSWIQAWLRQQVAVGQRNLHLLDAACGSGEGTWELAEAAAAAGWRPEQVQLAGWTLEPLEVWAAAHQTLPHEPQRQQRYRQRVSPLLRHGWADRVAFSQRDLLCSSLHGGGFDLIICNGLLGGPLLHHSHDLALVIANLAGLLLPGGALLLADRFHDGWKQKVSPAGLATLFAAQGLHLQQCSWGQVVT